MPFTAGPYERADTVVVGMVTAMVAHPATPTGEGSFEDLDAAVAVEQYLKGSGPAEVTVDDSLLCSYFDRGSVGHRYVIYLTGTENPFRTSLCSGNYALPAGDPAGSPTPTVVGAPPPAGSPEPAGPTSEPPPEVSTSATGGVAAEIPSQSAATPAAALVEDRTASAPSRDAAPLSDERAAGKDDSGFTAGDAMLAAGAVLPLTALVAGGFLYLRSRRSS